LNLATRVQHCSNEPLTWFVVPSRSHLQLKEAHILVALIVSAMLAALSRQSHGKGRKAPLHVLLPLPIIIQGVQAPSRVACRACSSSVASSPAADASSPAIFPGSGLATYTGSHALGSGWSKLPTGLQIKDLSTGRGARPKPGEQVTVHYTALDNNTDKLYECTFQSGKPAVFNLNEGYALFVTQVLLSVSYSVVLQGDISWPQRRSGRHAAGRSPSGHCASPAWLWALL